MDTIALRKVGRAADCTCFENRRTVRFRGFESLTFLTHKEGWLSLA